MIRINKLGAKVLIATHLDRNNNKWMVAIKSPTPHCMTLHSGSYKCDERQAIETAWIEYNYKI